MNTKNCARTRKDALEHRHTAGAVDYAPDGAVDFSALRARVHLSGLRPVDYDAAHLWITGLSALWIGGLVEERWGLASPPRPSGRTESCTLRILRMLFWCSRERMMKKMQGDSAPRGTTHRNAAAPHLLTHAAVLFAVLLLVYFVYFVVSLPHAVLFLCGPCFLWTLPTCSAARSAFLSILSILWFPSHMQCFFCVFCVFCGFSPRWQCCA